MKKLLACAAAIVLVTAGCSSIGENTTDAAADAPSPSTSSSSSSQSAASPTTSTAPKGVPAGTTVDPGELGLRFGAGNLLTSCYENVYDELAVFDYETAEVVSTTKPELPEGRESPTSMCVAIQVDGMPGLAVVTTSEQRSVGLEAARAFATVYHYKLGDASPTQVAEFEINPLSPHAHLFSAVNTFGVLYEEADGENDEVRVIFDSENGKEVWRTHETLQVLNSTMYYEYGSTRARPILDARTGDVVTYTKDGAEQIGFPSNARGANTWVQFTLDDRRKAINTDGKIVDISDFGFISETDVVGNSADFLVVDKRFDDELLIIDMNGPSELFRVTGAEYLKLEITGLDFGYDNVLRISKANDTLELMELPSMEITAVDPEDVEPLPLDETYGWSVVGDMGSPAYLIKQ